MEFEGDHRARIVLNEARKEIKGFHCNSWQFWPVYFSTFWKYWQYTPHAISYLDQWDSLQMIGEEIRRERARPPIGEND